MSTTDLITSAIEEALRKKNVVEAAQKEASKSAPALVVPKKEYTLEEGQRLFSDVFGYTPHFGDFPVSVLADSENPEVSMLVPPVDKDYEVQKKEAALLVAGIEDNDKVMISGPTGSGKSSLVKYVCAKLNRPFIRINMSGDVESASLFGTLVVEAGATKWRDGAVAEAVSHGAVCLVDEWELMPAEISMGMQNLLEEGGFLYLKEKPGTTADRTYIPHKNFRLVFAGNTTGMGDETGAHSGVGVQNTATIDRFSSTIHLGYLEKTHEIKVLMRKTTVTKDVATSMVQFAGLVRAAYLQGKMSLTISPRTLINWGRKAERFGIQDALYQAHINKLNDGDKAAIMELYVKVFGA